MTLRTRTENIIKKTLNLNSVIFVLSINIDFEKDF